MQYYHIHYTIIIQWRCNRIKLNVQHIVFVRMGDNWGCSLCSFNIKKESTPCRRTYTNKSFFVVHYFQLFLSIIYVISVSELLLNYGGCIKSVRASEPNSGKVGRKQHVFVDDTVQNYLMNFGYLPQSDIETGNLRTEEQLVEAIQTLQRFGNIEPTGIIDEDTRKLLQKRRCGLPDWSEGKRHWNSDTPSSGAFYHQHRRKKRFTLQGQTWSHTNLTWSLRTRNPENLEPGAVRRELASALNVWSQHSKLTFQEIDSDDADILVYFFKGYHNDGYAFDGKGQILAHAFFPGSGRGGDVHFDEDETWLLHDVGEFDDGTSLFAVAAHEFGHSLGLSHSSVPGALMYPWYQGIKPDELPEDDRHGIQQMYGPRENKLWGYIPPRWLTTTTTTTTPPTTTTTTTTTTQRTMQYFPRHPWKPPRKDHQHPDRRKYPYYPDLNIPDKYPNVIPSEQDPWPPRTPERPQRPPQRYPTSPRYPQYPVERFPSERYPGRPTTTTEHYFHHHHHHHHTTLRPTTTERVVIRRTRPTIRHSHKHNPGSRHAPPDKCNTSFDAIAVIRNEVFIFKNEYLWRIGDNGIYDGYPAEITRMWNDLPGDLSYVDAVYERPDRKIVFFIDKLYYLYNGNRVEKGYPKPLTHLGLPSALDHVDAAMVWGHNGKTYIYSGTMYWRLDEDTGKTELDYPRDMAMWGGVGYNIDTVFQWKDGKTYFFKGLGFWKFNDKRMQVEDTHQSLSGPFWMGCDVTHERFRPAEKPLRANYTFNRDLFDVSGVYLDLRPSKYLVIVILCYWLIL